MTYIILLIFIILIYLAIKLCMHTAKGQLEHYQTDLFDHLAQGKENNSWNQLRQGRNAVDCYKLTGRQCMKYSNCGLCTDNDKVVQCIPGDEQGPLFKENCDLWHYTNYYDRYQFESKVPNTSYPWSKFYPDYETRWPSPVAWRTLL